VLVIALLSFACVSLATVAFLRPTEDSVRRRILSGRLVLTTEERRTEGNFAGRVIAPLVRRIGGMLIRLLPSNLVRKVDRMLTWSNSSLSTPQFLTLWLACAVVGLLLLIFVLNSNPTATFTQDALMSLLVFGPFALGPYVVLRRRVKKRQKAITRSLPDALDLLVTGVEAGLGVDAAFAMVTDKTAGPLAETLVLYLKQVGLGRARRDALSDVAERTGVQDLIRVAAAVAQAEQMGATLGDVLRVQADDLRVLRRQRAQEAAQRAPVLMTIPMALCFLPAMGAVVIVPSVLNLLDFVGHLGAGH